MLSFNFRVVPVGCQIFRQNREISEILHLKFALKKLHQTGFIIKIFPNYYNLPIVRIIKSNRRKNHIFQPLQARARVQT